MDNKTIEKGEKKYQELKKRLGITENDEMLRMGCLYWAEWQRCSVEVKSPVVIDNRGVERLSPEARWMNDCFRMWEETAKKYGLTPYDQEKLKNGDKPASKKKSDGVPLRRVLNG